MVICFVPDSLLYKFGKPRHLRHVDLTLAHDKIICSTSLASGQQCSVCFNRVEICSCFLALYCAIRRLKLLLATSVKCLFYISTGGSGLNKYEKVLNTTDSNACSVKLLGKPSWQHFNFKTLHRWRYWSGIHVNKYSWILIHTIWNGEYWWLFLSHSIASNSFIKITLNNKTYAFNYLL